MFCKQSCPILNWLLGWEEIDNELGHDRNGFFQCGLHLRFDKVSQAHHMFIVQFTWCNLMY